MIDRTTPPSIQPASFAFSKPTKRVLRNGIPMYIIEAAGLGTIRIDFVFSAGQWHQARKLQALFACRMLREGCRGYTAAEFAEKLDYYGAWLELSVAMNRSFVTLYTLKKHSLATLDLVQRMLTEPSYSEEQFRTVCANNKAQLKVNLQRGDVIAMRALRHDIYGPHHPCGMNATLEDYDTLQVSDVKKFYRSYYGSSTCQIYLSGEVDDGLLNHIDELFGKQWGTTEVPCGKWKTTDTSVRYNPHPSLHKCHLEGAVQDSLRMGCLMMDVNDADYLPMRVLTTVLGGYFGSRLMKNVREDKGYTYHIGADLITNTPQTLFMVHCEAQAGKAEEIIGEVHREMLRLQNEHISDDELLMVRNYMTGEICRNYESAFALADAYIFIDHLGLPIGHIEQTIRAIHTTDTARLQQLAQRYLHPENLYSVVVHS